MKSPENAASILLVSPSGSSGSSSSPNAYSNGTSSEYMARGAGSAGSDDAAEGELPVTLIDACYYNYDHYDDVGCNRMSSFDESIKFQLQQRTSHFPSIHAVLVIFTILSASTSTSGIMSSEYTSLQT